MSKVFAGTMRVSSASQPRGHNRLGGIRGGALHLLLECLEALGAGRSSDR